MTNDAAKILTSIRAIEPQADFGALVHLADLREAAGLGRTFEDALMELAADDVLQLQSTDFPAGSSARERASWIPNGRGSFFIATGIRL